MARKGIEHNRLLLCYNMLRGGMNVMAAWKEAGKKIARSKAQLNRKNGAGAKQKAFMDGIAKQVEGRG